MIILIQKTQRIGVVGFELQKTTLIMNSLIFNYYSIFYNANRSLTERIFGYDNSVKLPAACLYMDLSCLFSTSSLIRNTGK
jgi:hypothetical protein